MRSANPWRRYLSLDARSLGLLRIGLAALLCTELVRRWGELTAFYTNEGVLPNHFSLFRPLGTRVFSFYHVLFTSAELEALFALTLAVFLGLALGYRTRLFQVASLVCWVGLDARNLFLEDTGSLVLNALLVWTLFLPLGQRFSLDALLSSLRAEREASAADLNRPLRVPFASRASLAAVGLRAQWIAIYACDLFGTTTGSGAPLTAPGAFDAPIAPARIPTRLGGLFDAWLSAHAPLLGHARSAIEAALLVLLVLPVGPRRRGLWAVLLALLAHGSSALLWRLETLPWALLLGFVALLARDDWAWIERVGRRVTRPRTLIFDADCGVCFAACRVLRRADLFGRLSFVANSDRSRIPESVDDAMLDRTLVVLGPNGRIASDERALYACLCALPFGGVLGFWLRVPLLSGLSRRAYAAFARNRARISSWLGLGACGLVAPPPALRHVAPVSRLRAFGLASAWAREASVLVLIVAVTVQLRIDNSASGDSLRESRPAWLAGIVEYPRLLQRWQGLFGRAVRERGHLVIDGRTARGKKLDPLTGAEPVFDPKEASSFGRGRLWANYFTRLRAPENAVYRPFLRDYIEALSASPETGQRLLASVDVWWVHETLPKPGEPALPLPPERLANRGLVRHSGAIPWLHAGPR